MNVILEICRFGVILIYDALKIFRKKRIKLLILKNLFKKFNYLKFI